MCKTCFRVIAALCALHAFQVHAAGLKYEKASTERYIERFDDKVGWVVVDTTRDIEYTKCLLGLDYREDLKYCLGPLDQLTWEEASRFSKKIGAGWRLPSIDELVDYAKTNPDFQKTLTTYARGAAPDIRVWAANPIDGSPTKRAVLYANFQQYLPIPDQFLFRSADAVDRIAVLYVRVAKGKGNK